jgi:hypothetical protein
MSNSDPRKALTAIVGGLQSAFKRFDRSARKTAWKAIQSGAGKKEIDSLLNNPSQQVTGLPRLLSFKEWMQNNS